MPLPPECRAEIRVDREMTGEDLVAALARAREVSARCGCRVVSLIFPVKDEFRVIKVGCLRPRQRRAPGGA